MNSKLASSKIVIGLMSLFITPVFAATTSTDQCEDLNGKFSGAVIFSGYKFGRYIQCHGDLETKSSYKDNVATLSLDIYNCRCTNYSGCIDIAYTISGTCHNSSVVYKHGTLHGEVFRGTINQHVLEFNGDNWSCNLIKK